MQAVGAFVFLRLICPSIRAPQLFGLTAGKPDEGADRTLGYLSKVMLAMANKNLDKDKDSWLVQARDFLNATAHEYDDFIDVLSLDRPSHQRTLSMVNPSNTHPTSDGERLFGDESDVEFQRFAESRLLGLRRLHRESIPRQPQHLDKGIALATLVSYAVRNAQLGDEYERRTSFNDGENELAIHHHNDDGINNGRSTPSFHSGGAESESEMRLNLFMDLCCDIEDSAGYYIDRAGFNPAPIGRGAERSPTGHLTVVKSSRAFAAARSDVEISANLPTSRNGRRLRSATVSMPGTSPEDMLEELSMSNQAMTTSRDVLAKERRSPNDEDIVRRKISDRFSWRHSSDLSKSSSKPQSHQGHDGNGSRSSAEEEEEEEEQEEEEEEDGAKGSMDRGHGLRLAQHQRGQEEESKQVMRNIEAMRRAGAAANERKRWWKRK